MERCGQEIKENNDNVWSVTSDEGRLYIKRKGGKGLMSVERCIREDKNSLGFYVAKSEENLIEGVAAAEIINTENTVTSG